MMSIWTVLMIGLIYATPDAFPFARVLQGRIVTPERLDSLEDDTHTFMFIDSVTFMPLRSWTGKEWLDVQWKPARLIERARSANVRRDRRRYTSAVITLSGRVQTSKSRLPAGHVFVAMGRRFNMTGRLLDLADRPSDDTMGNVPYVQFLPEYHTTADSNGFFTIKATITEDSWLVISGERYNAALFNIGLLVKYRPVTKPRRRLHSRK